MIGLGEVEVKKDIGHMSGNEAGLKSAGSQQDSNLQDLSSPLLSASSVPCCRAFCLINSKQS